ncbi:MAG: hypothetical protein LBM08_08615 [Dysgonamonadaceae bacterium]|jgi:hypothetical protein|nr:hypothetical protein [Dysgonamonadaceae bacterium]
MNRRILFITLFAVTTVFSISAQKLREGNLDFLKGETKLNIVFDYSNLKIEGRSEEYYIEKNGIKWKENWDNAKNEFFEKFVRNVNLKLIEKEKQLRCGNFLDSKYQATVRVLELDNDKDMDAEIIIAQMDNNQILARLTLTGKAGSFGTMTNLVGDAMKDAGEKIGKLLVKKL